MSGTHPEGYEEAEKRLTALPANRKLKNYASDVQELIQHQNSLIRQGMIVKIFQANQSEYFKDLISNAARSDKGQAVRIRTLSLIVQHKKIKIFRDVLYHSLARENPTVSATLILGLGQNKKDLKNLEYTVTRAFSDSLENINPENLIRLQTIFGMVCKNGSKNFLQLKAMGKSFLKSNQNPENPARQEQLRNVRRAIVETWPDLAKG